LVLLSRYPLENLSFRELMPQAGFFEHRVVLHATALTPWGDVDVFVTHLTNGDPGVNREQAESLKVFVDDTGSDLAVISGDFNAGDDSPQIGSLSRVWVDAYRRVNPEGDGATCCIDTLSQGPGDLLEKRIDYVFIATSSGVAANVIQASILFDEPYITSGGWLWASDHAGLVVDLAVVPKE
jgi:endonuclease/exonuclease/phosphatase family metal-dependent hydrolase